MRSLEEERIPPKQVLCQRCDQPFIPQKLFRRIIQTAIENTLDRYTSYFELCPKCRLQLFAEQLIGDELVRVERVKHVARRRSEKLEPVKVDTRLGTTVYKSECSFCNQGCDALVHVKDGKVVKVEGDASSSVTKGVLCSKGLASKEVLYHRERLLYSMKRSAERGENKWERISWDEAYTIVRRFKEIEERYGKYSVALATGTQRG